MLAAAVLACMKITIEFIKLKNIKAVCIAFLIVFNTIVRTSNHHFIKKNASWLSLAIFCKA